MNNSSYLPPATLIVGTSETRNAHARTLIKQAFCKEASCFGLCSHCQSNEAPQYHQALWILPEKKYTLDLLEPISHKISFALDPNDHFFFVLEKTDFLTPACANSLLKIVEEPPRGYHFLFLANQSQLVIPTIRSRCHIVYTGAIPRAASSGFLRHFMGKGTNTPAQFLKDLQTDCPEDFETPECLDLLLAHWSEQYQNNLLADKQNAQYAHAMITLLQQALEHPPMPGSAKIFWRDLFLQKG